MVHSYLKITGIVRQSNQSMSIPIVTEEDVTKYEREIAGLVKDEKPGPEWVTADRLSAIWGITHQGARARVDSLVRYGKMECKTFKTLAGRCLIPVRHYRLKK
jgi:predicted ArsR family transcriptional regulator